MVNTKDLLGALMDGGLSGSSRSRVDYSQSDRCDSIGNRSMRWLRVFAYPRGAKLT